MSFCSLMHLSGKNGNPLPADGMKRPDDITVVRYWNKQIIFYCPQAGRAFPFLWIKKETKNPEKPSQPTGHGRPCQRWFFALRAPEASYDSMWYNSSETRLA